MKSDAPDNMISIKEARARKQQRGSKMSDGDGPTKEEIVSLAESLVAQAERDTEKDGPLGRLAGFVTPYMAVHMSGLQLIEEASILADLLTARRHGLSREQQADGRACVFLLLKKAFYLGGCVKQDDTFEKQVKMLKVRSGRKTPGKAKLQASVLKHAEALWKKKGSARNSAGATAKAITDSVNEELGTDFKPSARNGAIEKLVKAHLKNRNSDQ